MQAGLPGWLLVLVDVSSIVLLNSCSAPNSKSPVGQKKYFRHHFDYFVFVVFYKKSTLIVYASSKVDHFPEFRVLIIMSYAHFGKQWPDCYDKSNPQGQKLFCNSFQIDLLSV